MSTDSGMSGRGHLLLSSRGSYGSPEWNSVLKHLNLPILGHCKGFQPRTQQEKPGIKHNPGSFKP